MKNSLPFTQEDLENLANERSYERGTDYYDMSGKVSADELLKMIKS